jgi:mono/diheme cytochrome c family protein
LLAKIDLGTTVMAAPMTYPDLRRMSDATNRLFYDIVLQGLYGRAGMARWDDVLSPEDAHNIRAYILDEAWTAYGAGAP